MSKSSSRASRTMERLHQLAEIGRVDGLQGTTSPGLGRREQRACELVAAWMAEAGLDVGWDAHGNLFGGLAGTRPGAGEVWSGSHLDTVPDGGRFDGALGVLCGLEAVVANGRRAATQRVVVFRDEEGWRFGRGCFGSRAVCGRLADGELEARDADGVSVAEALAALAIEPGGSARRAARELRRGARRAGARARAAGVRAGRGDRDRRHGRLRDRVRRQRRATPARCRCRADGMRWRPRPSSCCACAPPRCSIPQAVSTVGDLRIAEPAANVIPGRVSLTLDLRAPAADALASLADDVPAIAAAAAAERRCAVAVETTWRLPPAPMSDCVRAAIRDAATATGHPIAALPSGAGHDAGILVGGRRGGRDAVRAQPKQRCQPPPGRADGRGRRRRGDRGAHRNTGKTVNGLIPSDSSHWYDRSLNP